MQQHPVPQHISSYEFKLVGDMTLKQFFQLAGGVVIALIFYATPLPGFIKWPLVLFFGSMGAALAFLPFEERPLSIWILAFFRAAYAPTKYVWVENGAEEVFAPNTSPVILTTEEKAAETSLVTTPESEVVEGFEKAEKNFFQRIASLVPAYSGIQQEATSVAEPAVSATTVPVPTPSISPQVNMPIAVPQTQPVGTAPVANFSTGVTYQTGYLSQNPITQNNTVATTPAVEKKETRIPTTQSIKVESITPQQIVTTLPASQPSREQPTLTPVFSQPVPSTTIPKGPQQAIYTLEAAPPAPPEILNTIVGRVLTAEGKIIEGAILEIRDAENKPVRALRTNKVGHFITVTPLADGDYDIEVEKEGYVFDKVRFRAEGRLIPPIQIQAKQITTG